MRMQPQAPRSGHGATTSGSPDRPRAGADDRRGRATAGAWRVRATVVAAGVLAIAMLLAPVAHAKTSCAYAGAPASRLTVTVSGDISFAVIERRGLEITAREIFGAPEPCAGGTPTVLNTDTIVVRLIADSPVFELRLDGGPFAPGATGEPEGAAEIEIHITGALLAEVIGTSAGEEFRWGPGGALAGLNLNPRNDGDRDVDVTVSGDSFLIANGAGGDDTITAQPGASIRDGVFSIGGPGNDLLRAPPGTDALIEGGSGDDVIIGSRRKDDLLGEGGNDRVSGRAGPDHISGGRGNDRLSGGSGRDDITGGPGNDRLSGGSGRDVINSRDSKRDSVSCGPGRDRVKADRRDHLRGCETRRIAR